MTITFGGFDLQSNGVYVTDTDVDSTADRNIQTEKLAETDGAVIVKTNFEAKKFSIQGYIVADTVAGLRPLLNNFKIALAKEEQNFDYDDGSGTIRWVATAKNMIISRPQGLNRATFSVEFECEGSAGSDTTTTNLISGYVVTSSTDVIPVTVGGSYQAEPLITLTITSLTGSATNTISIANNTTLRGVSLTRAFNANDVIEIDCLKKTIYVNNTVADYSGQFPRWDVGTGAVSYVDDFTARSVTVNATYTRRYL